jgi:GNAT superfamily N-acetyltransferase
VEETRADVLELRATSYDHPDAVALTEQTQQYYVQIYGGPDRDPLTAELLSPPSGGFLVGYLEQRPVVMGGWLVTADAGRDGDAQLRRMYTDPAVRGRGYGRQLLAALERDAAAHGATRMVLSTGMSQPDAIRLYRSVGYVDIEPFGMYGGKPTVVCLGKSLPGVS